MTHQANADERVFRVHCRPRETEDMLLVICTPLALEIGHCDLPNRVSLGHVCAAKWCSVSFSSGSNPRSAHRKTYAPAPEVDPLLSHAHMSNYMWVYMETSFFRTDLYLTCGMDATAVTGTGSSPSGASIASTRRPFCRGYCPPRARLTRSPLLRIITPSIKTWGTAPLPADAPGLMRDVYPDNTISSDIS